MPYVTEEIFTKLPIKTTESIMISNYPVCKDEYVFETNLDETIEIIKAIRKIKLENNIGKEFSLNIENTDNIDIINNVIKPQNLDITNLKEVVVNKNISIYMMAV